MSFTKIPVLFLITVHEEVVDLVGVVRLLDEHDKVLLSVTWSFHSTFQYFFCRNRPGIRAFESPLDSQREIVPFVGPRVSQSVRFQSFVSEFLVALVTFVTAKNDFPVLSWLPDGDRQDDNPSSSEWSARLRHAWRSVLPMVTSSQSKSSEKRCSPKDSWLYSTYASVMKWSLGYNLWRSFSRPGSQGPQRKCPGCLSTTSRKLKV